MTTQEKQRQRAHEVYQSMTQYSTFPYCAALIMAYLLKSAAHSHPWLTAPWRRSVAAHSHKLAPRDQASRAGP